MAEPTSASSDNTGGRATVNVRAQEPATGSARLNRLWSGLALLFVFIVASTLVSFFWKSDVLTRELSEHYGRTVARYGREFELRYENYRQVVDNLTRIAGAPGAPSEARLRVQSASARVLAIQSAKSALDLQVKAQTEAIEYARDQVKQAREQATAGLTGAAARHREIFERLGAAATALERALEANATVEAEQHLARDALVSAELALRAAQRSAEAAARATENADAATKAPPGSAEARHREQQAIAASQEASREEAGAAAAAHRPPKSLELTPPTASAAAQHASRHAMDAKDAAVEAAANAQTALGRAEQRRAKTRLAVADASEVLVGAANAADDAASAERVALDRRDQRGPAPAAAQNSVATQLRSLTTQQAHVDVALRVALDKSDQSVANHARAIGKILPSFIGLVRRCFDPSSTEEQDLCIARGMLEANKSKAPGARSLEIVGCQGRSAATGAVLARDNSAIFFPPSASEGALAACGRVPLRNLLASFDGLDLQPAGGRGAPSRTFDEAMLLDAKGNVVFAPKQDSVLRLLALPKFDAKSAGASHVLDHVAIGTKSYRVFLQPTGVQLNSECAAGGDCSGDHATPTALIVAGLVAEDRLLSERLEVTPGTFLWAVILVGLLALALPVAKLWFVSANSRVRRFDVGLLVWSAVATTLLGILLCLSFAAYGDLATRLDADLKAVTGPMRERLQARMRHAATLLDAYIDLTKPLQQALTETRPAHVGAGALEAACKHRSDAREAGAGADAPGACAGASVLDSVSYEADQPPLSMCEQVRCDLAAVPADPRAPSDALWSQAFLTDLRGWQRVKAVPGEHAPNPISVADRAYFRGALARACSKPECGRSEYTEVVRSATTGELLLVTAKAVFQPSAATSAERARDPEPIGTAGLTLALPEFQSPILPLRFQTAIIDAQGKIMLHSNNSAFHGQNLFDDVDDPAELRAALAAGMPALISLRYRGERSRVRLERLPDANWWVLGIAPLTIADLVVSRSVILTLAGFGVLLFTAPLLFGLVAYWSRRRRRSGARSEPPLFFSLRPNSAAVGEYADAGRWSLIVSCVGIAITTLSKLPLFGLLLVSAVAAFGGLMRVPGIGRRGPLAILRPSTAPAQRAQGIRPWLGEAGRRVLFGWLGVERIAQRPCRALPVAFALCCFGLGTLLITTPMTILFSAAHDYMQDSLARAQQDHFARSGAVPECVSHDDDSNCGAVYFGTAREDSPELDAPRSTSIWVHPLPRLATWLPPFEPTSGTNASRLTLADAPVEPPGMGWRWVRTDGALALVPAARPDVNAAKPGTAPTSSAPARGTGPSAAPRGPDSSAGSSGGAGILLATAVPSLANATWNTLGLPLFLLLGLGALAFVCSVRIYERLFHLDLLPRLEDGPTSAEQVVRALARRPRIFVPYGLARFEAELRSFAESDQGKNAFWLFAVRCADGPERLAESLREASSSAKVIVLCDDDPLCAGTAERRAAWAALLVAFEIQSPRAVLDERWGALGHPTRAELTLLWANADADERRVLAQLAVDGYANPQPRNGAVLERLARKGFIDPESLSIRSSALQQHVRDAVAIADVSHWDDSERGTTWSSVRGVLVATLALLVAVVAAVQPSFVAAGAMVPTLAATLPAIVRLLTMVAGGEAGK